MKMKPLQTLNLTQFLSAFADNMILFITLAIIKMNAFPDYYIGVVQASFLVAFVVLAPFVGAIADKHSKSRVLLVGNAIKSIGIIAMFLHVDPAVSYGIVGIGAAVYSPAKYGILPALTHSDHELLRANARMEGYTIMAILLGSVCGGILAKMSLSGSMIACLALYLLSLQLTLQMPKMQGDRTIRYGKAARTFVSDMSFLLKDRATRFSLVGTGSFWMTSSVVRLAIIAWVPAHLGIQSVDQISMLVAVTGVGIMIGALMTPKLVPARRYYNSFIFGILMIICILLFPLITNLYLTIGLLLLVGFSGGVFIVPMNAVLQDRGQGMIGSGKTIAVQNFLENAMMLAGVGLYTQISKDGLSPDLSITGIACILAGFVVYLIVQRERLKLSV
ncbi:lysophospholipid transporter LplT [Paenibacillus sp. CGMCC 1.16610]|uniref:Lysophospholipid transporter LplT n=1 Tax=Paenibacillus anseongense TaxID=2682845 RepID=A0ABW9UBF8_9BACL|nr:MULTISPECIES: lysophospholipid transporter LplT [Paenibacillus]MBA2939216.1 lysophospholipid transporter LplT [Paenibacillus sp. CGMCC 1.16610]MVQ35175.1 lysophospholipid transporter LplT [Paenibacillus anseongense]